MNALLSSLAYPLRTAPLFLIVVFSLLLTLASWSLLFGLPLAIIVISWYLKYSFVVFDTISLGITEPPVLSTEMVNPADEQRPLGQFAVIALVYVLTGYASPLLSDEGVRWLRYLCLALLPASMAALGVSSNLLQAINPRVIFGMIYRLGATYFLVLVLIVLLLGAVVLLLRMQLSSVFSIAIVMYGWLAVASVIATALYENRVELGLETFKSPEQDVAREHNEVEQIRDRAMDEIYSHWRIGSFANAWQAVEARVKADGEPIVTYTWMYVRCTRWPDLRFAAGIARELVPLLLRSKQDLQAFDIVRERIRADATFRPARSADLVSLVNISRNAGDRATARILLRDFEHHFPNDPAQLIVLKLREQLTP